MDDVGVSVSDQQLFDDVRDGFASRKYPVVAHADAALDALAERLTDLRAENETCIEERDLFYDRLSDLRAENNLFDERGRKLAEMTRRAITAEKRFVKAEKVIAEARRISHLQPHHDLPVALHAYDEYVRLDAPQKEAVKPPKELPPMWESTDGGYSKEEPQKEAGA